MLTQQPIGNDQSRLALLHPTPADGEGPARRASDISLSLLETSRRFTLTLSCRNRSGIVAKVSAILYAAGFDIREASQHDDHLSGHFFMRVAFNGERGTCDAEMLSEQMQAVSREFSMSLSLREVKGPRRVLILVSRFDHCLADLLYRQHIGELDMTIAGIVANYPRETFGRLDFGAAPFHFLPMTKATKRDQEKRLLDLIDETATETVVLARYMQVLTEETTQRLSGRCINIHHSFLPGFKGAKPYHQAHERGVKLIGATAHYVTGDLDEGPIIEQDVERISHGDAPETLVRKGRDIERRVLARALRYHIDDRVILNGARTVVFAD